MKKEILLLQEEMKKNNIDIYLLSSNDPHSSENVPDYFKIRNFYSGFTGSNGDMLITKDRAILWTDGRYFIQAERQMKSTGTELYKIGVEGYPSIEEFLINNLKKGMRLALDSKLFSTNFVRSLKNKLEGDVVTHLDLASKFWNNRPSFPSSKTFALPTEISGKSVSDKLSDLRDYMKKKDVKTHIMTTLDEIAWLFNFRAHDIESTPVAYSYALIDMESAHLFISESKYNDIKSHFDKNNITIHKYEDFEDYLKENEFETVVIDPDRLNFYLYSIINEKAEVKEDINHTLITKAIKNEVELENMKKIHLIDGIAVTKFMCWLKSNYNNKKVTEISAQEKLEDFRKKSDIYIEPSFSTISAYGPNAAMMHYSADKENETVLEEGNLYLVDSGGHYMGGSTDITRTYALGSIPKNMKVDFTRVLKAVIGLSTATFLEGCTGVSLDVLSRIELWKHHIDYRSGTGHGIGYMLAVHEAPNGFRWRLVKERFDSAILKPGMITTVEPGIYKENEYGIRLENMLVTEKDEKNEYGQFLKFENIALSPLDLDAILPEMLSEEEKAYLNNYHAEVYKKLSPYMDDNELEILKNYTRKI